MLPLSLFTKLTAAVAVPPVASKSSIIIIFCPCFIEEISTSKVSFPYSNSYSSEITSHGSLPFFLSGIKEIFNFSANNAAKINPLASIPAIALILLSLYLS